MPRVKQFDENEVLEKAMNLFWKQGYSATSIQDLVENLGINRASLYATFGDKEKLFKKSLELYRKTNTEGLKEFFANQANIKAGFLKLFEIAIKNATEDQDRKGCFVVNTTTELIPGDQTIIDALEQNRQNFVNIFYEFLKKGENDSQFDKGKDLKSIALLIYILYSGFKVVSKIQTDKKILLEPVKQVLSLLD